MSDLKKRIERIEDAAGGAVKDAPKFLVLFEVFVLDDWKDSSGTLCAECAELDGDWLPGMYFGFDEFLQKHVAGIRSKGGEVALVFDVERCGRDVKGYRLQGELDAPELERIRSRVTEETLFGFDGASESSFIEAFKEWKGAHNES